jgi:CheY-like chemotaxis protein
VVDDNATTRALIGDVVRSWRGNPLAAGSASEALSALERAWRRGRLPALAIVDLDMPGMPGGVLADLLAADDRLAAVPVIAITSPGEGGRPEAPRGCIATVAKPILESELREATRAALARGDDRARDVAGAAGAVPEPAAPPTEPGLRVLVADDNRVDRTLTVRLLEKAGHAVFAVESGEEAIQACASGAFDVLLMDVQMPHVSGLDATAAIRARERRTGAHLPIIALTADDDSARCLEAGMDAYLAKPVHPREMAEAIALAIGAADPAAVAEDAAGEAALDARLALAQAGGDRSLLVDLAQMCLADGPVALERIREALVEGDPAAVRRTAHKLRGSLLVLAATPAARAAQHLEVLCAQGRLEKARAAAAALEHELDRLRPELSGILGAAAAAADAKRPRTSSAAIAHLDS